MNLILLIYVAVFLVQTITESVPLSAGVKPVLEKPCGKDLYSLPSPLDVLLNAATATSTDSYGVSLTMCIT